MYIFDFLSCSCGSVTLWLLDTMQQLLISLLLSSLQAVLARSRLAHGTDGDMHATMLSLDTQRRVQYWNHTM